MNTTAYQSHYIHLQVSRWQLGEKYVLPKVSSRNLKAFQQLLWNWWAFSKCNCTFVTGGIGYCNLMLCSYMSQWIYTDCQCSVLFLCLILHLYRDNWFLWFKGMHWSWIHQQGYSPQYLDRGRVWKYAVWNDRLRGSSFHESWQLPLVWLQPP